MDVSESGVAQRKEDATHGVNNGSARPASSPRAEISADITESLDDIKKDLEELYNQVELAKAKEEKNDEELLMRPYELTACRRMQFKKDRKELDKLLDIVDYKLDLLRRVRERDQRLVEEKTQERLGLCLDS